MKFVYVGRVSCFMTDAASIRVHNVADMLKSQGHHVDFICQEGTVPCEKNTNENSTFYGVFDDDTGKLSKVFEWLSGKRTANYLKKLLENEHYDGVILYNAPITLAKKALKICRDHGVVLINDVTEWYEIRFSNGLLSYLFAWLVDRRIRFFDQKCDGVIVISSYLEEFYKEKIPTINLPPVFEKGGRRNTSKNAHPRFLYAGSPSKKDELFHFIEAVKSVNCESVSVEMTVIGAPMPKDGDQLSLKGIRFFARKPREDILDALGEHDFSVLLRREERYAKAGYSTKVAEALYHGTPVFCNEIGGADADVLDGVNGVKIRSADSHSIKKELVRIIEMPPEKIASMKQRAFEFGQKKYSRRNYEESLSAFVTSLVTKA